MGVSGMSSRKEPSVLLDFAVTGAGQVLLTDATTMIGELATALSTDLMLAVVEKPDGYSVKMHLRFEVRV